MAASPTPRIFIVHNPVAGTSDPVEVRRVIVDRLSLRGWDHEIHETAESDDVAEIARAAQARGYDAVWAAGGDGTVSGVANGLINVATPLGIIPMGTGNALARELGIPLDLEGACELLTGEHAVRRIDAMKVEDTHYVLSVGVGISSLTMAETPREQKRRFGRIAYIWNGIGYALSTYRWQLFVTIDGERNRVRAQELNVTNARILGVKPIGWGAQVKIDDGQVDLCYVQASTLAGIMRSIAGLALARQDQVPEIECRPIRSTIEIDSRRRLPVQGDGESIGHTPVRIEVVPAALNVLTPANEP